MYLLLGSEPTIFTLPKNTQQYLHYTWIKFQWLDIYETEVLKAPAQRVV
jgi:hypothetical protein